MKTYCWIRSFIISLVALGLLATSALAAPTRIEDLAGRVIGPTDIGIMWTTPTPTAGRTLNETDCRTSTVAITDRNWTSRTQLSEAPPASPGTGVNLNISGLALGTRYYIMCKTKDSSGAWSALSNAVVVTTPPTVDWTPILSWTASPDARVTGYRLYEGTQSGSYVTTIECGNTTTCQTGSKPWGPTTYFYVVRAHDDGGVESANSNEVYIQRDLPN